MTGENLAYNVRWFMQRAGQSVDVFNARQTALYVGLCCEELAETLEAIGASVAAKDLRVLSGAFKSGEYDAWVERRANRVELLDGCIDLAWVALGCAYAQGASVPRAIAKVATANLDKFRNGADLDENGKQRKPPGWVGPDLSDCLA